MIDFLNIDVEAEISSQDFQGLVSQYSDSAQSYDTILNKTFYIQDIVVVDKNIFCVIDDGVLVALETSKELEWFYNVFLPEYKFNNRRSLLEFIEEEKVILYAKLQVIQPKVLITNVKDTVDGSIIDYHIENLYKEFFDQYKLVSSYNTSPNDEQRNEMIEFIKVYSAIVKSKNAGGYIVSILGVDSFIPNSMMYRKQDGSDYLVGDVVKVVIENYVRDKGAFIVSNLKYIQMVMPSVIHTIDKNEHQTGNVVGVSNFGLFISFRDNLYGLLHKSEMSEDTLIRFENKEFSNGDVINFYIKEYKDGKIDLTEMSQQTLDKNWDDKVFKYKGKIFNFKAIKEIKSGVLFEFDDSRIRGFLYEMELRKYPYNIVVGNTYPVYVYDMDKESGKVYLKCPNSF
jgi:ribosomal protein S1